ncbi:MAG: thiamine/thiamine pyrophosphate ABC transporter permease ThiP [Rhodospirillales bacterium]|nr:thiamine/thiamine pyrophosphate ABC transporter permease ThiP [Rhodospirillales bacterium]
MMVGHRPLLWPGLVALCALLGLAAAALAALLARAPALDPASVFDHYTLRVLRFTLMQAGLSTLISVAFALPVARALARRQRFRGRTLLLRLMGLPLVLPVIVAVFGIAAVWGRNGALNHGLQALGLESLGLTGIGPLYGLTGILIAHIFFNMPLAVRLLLPVWEAIPGETWRLASQLGMGSGAILRLIELPRLLPALPGAAILIFLLCFTSFAVVLTLGGGPAATTLEVAIYRAMRLEFDIPRAVTLGLLQVAICAGVALLLLRLAPTVPGAATGSAAESRMSARPDTTGPMGRLADCLWIATGSLWVLGPLVAIVVAGLTGPLVAVLARAEVWQAALRSVTIGLGAGLLAVTLGTLLLFTTHDLAVRSRRPRLADRLELAGSLTLVIPPVVLGAGLFVLLLPLVPVFDWALPLAATVNGLVATPYVLRLLGPVLRRSAERHDRLCASLGLAGLNRLRHLEWPGARPMLGSALALTSALATGDLAAIALFGTERDATLALLIFRALGSYRMDEAAVLSLLLVGLCLVVFIVIEGAARGRART